MALESSQYYWQERERLIDLWGTANLEERQVLLKRIMKLEDTIESFDQQTQ
jgi:hypothetical protein